MIWGNICSSTALSTKNPVWNTLHWNPGLCDKKPALYHRTLMVQGGSNMTGTYAACLHRNQSRSYLNHLVLEVLLILGIFNKKQWKYQ